jgi:hypothetical protein
MENVAVEKRKNAFFTEEERKILKWLFLKALIPIILALIISSTLLYFGLDSLMEKASFANYAFAPARSVDTIARFVSTYTTIALLNIVLIVALCVIVMYLAMHDIVMPVLRITRDLKQIVDTKSKEAIMIRASDKLLKPLVDLINKITV